MNALSSAFLNVRNIHYTNVDILATVILSFENDRTALSNFFAGKLTTQEVLDTVEKFHIKNRKTKTVGRLCEGFALRVTHLLRPTQIRYLHTSRHGLALIKKNGCTYIIDSSLKNIHPLPIDGESLCFLHGIYGIHKNPPNVSRLAPIISIRGLDLMYKTKHQAQYKIPAVRDFDQMVRHTYSHDCNTTKPELIFLARRQAEDQSETIAKITCRFYKSPRTISISKSHQPSVEIACESWWGMREVFDCLVDTFEDIPNGDAEVRLITNVLGKCIIDAGNNPYI